LQRIGVRLYAALLGLQFLDLGGQSRCLLVGFCQLLGQLRVVQQAPAVQANHLVALAGFSF
jgi:hypothetical protein